MALHFLDLEKLSLTFLESSVFLSILCVGFDEILVCFQLSLFPLTFDFQSICKTFCLLSQKQHRKVLREKGIRSSNEGNIISSHEVMYKTQEKQVLLSGSLKKFLRKASYCFQEKNKCFLACYYLVVPNAERIKKRGGICNSDGGVGVENIVCDCKQDVV